MIRKWLAIGIILLFVGVTIAPALAQNTEKSQSTSRGNWLYVGGSGPGNYSRIQDAINDASDGDTVFVYDDSSPYYERIYINKSILLQGENKKTTIIDSNEAGTTVTLSSDRIQISKFTLQNSGIEDASGIQAGFIQDLSIDNTIVKNHDYGLLLINVENLSIHDNELSENKVGVRLNSCTRGQVYTNTIDSNGQGIISWSQQINFSFNLFKDNSGGLIMYPGDIENNVFENVFRDNGVGIELWYFSSLIEMNLFENNKIGLNIKDGRFYQIEKNNFVKNKVQASFSYSIGNPRENEFDGNFWSNHMDSQPKIIIGKIYKIFSWQIRSVYYSFTIAFPWFIFDSNPAQEPYDIPGMS
jgi:parallel beta-helix repeat protein